MEQKQVKLIGLRVQNNGIIQAAELTPDLLQKRLVLVTGHAGNGKSSLLNGAKIATAGTDAIKKSDALPDGFIAEALMADGEVPIYIGVKTDTYAKGEHAGEQKLTTYLYTKDLNGKAIAPVIDGIQWTAAKYWSALTTELTHSFNDLFSENQTVQRKLIEKLFKEELAKLHADELAERILTLKQDRDSKRLICQANGAYMERFEEEGWNETKLGLLQKVDVNELRHNITALEVEKAKKLGAPQAEYELACERLNNARKDALQKIKDRGAEARQKLQEKEAEIETAYNNAIAAYGNNTVIRDNIKHEYESIANMVADYIGFDESKIIRNEQGAIISYTGDSGHLAVMDEIRKVYEAKIKPYVNLTEPVKENRPQELVDAVNVLLDEYRKLEATPIDYPEKGTVDVTEYDTKISRLLNEVESAELTNKLYDKYQMWQSWMQAKEMYDAELDKLRKLYASIETGVPGMKIVPRTTDSGRVEVWVMYDGSYDTEFFYNPKKEMRFLFEYSSFQRTIIGLMLQAARLNLKPKALRLAFVDDVAFTTRDIDVLQTVAEQLDLRLITAWTHEVDKEKLLDGQVMVEGGEIFFDTEK